MKFLHLALTTLTALVVGHSGFSTSAQRGYIRPGALLIRVSGPGPEGFHQHDKPGQ